MLMVRNHWLSFILSDMKTNGFQKRLGWAVGKSIILLVLLHSVFLLQAQETVSSGKSWIYIDTQEKKADVATTDETPPVIKIISPELSGSKKYVSKETELEILGKITDDNSGINRIFINSEKFELTKDGLFVRKVKLEKGTNTISIFAVDNNDNVTKLNLEVECTAGPVIKNLPVRIAGKYYALLIGVNNYIDPSLPNLDYPIADAEALYKVLITDYLFDKENIILLKNAKRTDINMALDNLAKKITPEDNLLIFYAGHGWWDPNADIGYWLPSDANKNYKSEWFRNSTLCDYIREINSRHTLLVTDACFGGSIFKTRSISMEAPKAIQMLYDLRSRKAMTSGTLTEVPDRSSFVKYLIQRLDENTEQCLSSEQLFSSFRIAVINNSDVIPQYGEIKNVGDEGGDFIFIRRD
jgi:hypothetical protein